MRWTGRADGDLRSAARRDSVDGRPWAWLHQVHGALVHRVDRPGAVQGADGDALVTDTPGVVLAVFTADCAPVAFASPEGIVALAHAGWRGAEEGVIGATVAAMRDLGATDITAALGPCIRPGCYEFGEDRLGPLVDRFGAAVRGEARTGRPALDLPALVRSAVEQADATLVLDAGACTACDADAWFSHRARHDLERQATLVSVDQ